MRMVEGWRRYKNKPLEIPTKIFGIPPIYIWDGVRQIIRSVFTHRKTAIKAGHAMSKDWTAGLLAVMWLLIHWGRGMVICTGPTGRQVKDIMFAEIASQYSRLRKRFPEFKKDWLTTTSLKFSEKCFATGFTTKDTNEMVGKFQGLHSENMLIIITEAQAVDSSVFKQLRGLMTSPNSRLIELGNPLVPFGDYYQHCVDSSFGYNVIHLPVWLSPNIVAGKEIIPGMCSKTWVEEFRTELLAQGIRPEEDPEWQARVEAEFPQQSSLAWIPLIKIKAAVGRKFRDADRLRVGGLDPAGEGDDETVHCVLEGPAMLKQDCFRKVLTPETVGWARGLIEEDRLEAMAIDEGYNPGIRDWLNFERMPISGINFGSTEGVPEKFANFGTYIWALLREAFMMEEIGILNDPILVYQLSSRRVERLPNGQLKLESKKKSGKKSPDRADALALAWYQRLMMIGGLDILEGGDSESSKMQNEISRADRSPAAIKHGAAADRKAMETFEDDIIVGDSSLEADDISF